MPNDNSVKWYGDLWRLLNSFKGHFPLSTSGIILDYMMDWDKSFSVMLENNPLNGFTLREWIAGVFAYLGKKDDTGFEFMTLLRTSIMDGSLADPDGKILLMFLKMHFCQLEVDDGDYSFGFPAKILKDLIVREFERRDFEVAENAIRIIGYENNHLTVKIVWKRDRDYYDEDESEDCRIGFFLGGEVDKCKKCGLYRYTVDKNWDEDLCRYCREKYTGGCSHSLSQCQICKEYFCNYGISENDCDCDDCKKYFEDIVNPCYCKSCESNFEDPDHIHRNYK